MKLMKSYCLVTAVLLKLLFQIACTCDNESSFEKTCPLWSIQTDNNTCSCRTYYNVQVLYCGDDAMTVDIPYCYCFSYNKDYDTMVVGYCVFRCHVQLQNPARNGAVPGGYRLLATTSTTNKSELNRVSCNDLEMNRTGQLCGSCLEGYTPPVYSYDLSCVECSDYKYNWLKYIAVAYLPLTAFYIAALILRIPATSGVLNGFIMTCQIFASPTMLRLFYITVIINSGNNTFVKVFVKILMTIYGIWNLDFFRALYPSFCIHPSMNTLQTLALDYAVAIYPLVLVVVTYQLVDLHDHSLTCVRLWRPFYKCLMCLRREWNIKTSLISTFATFILLSYVKYLNTSLDLLATTTQYDLINDKSLDTYYLTIDGTIEFFGKQHLPYALLAIFMLVLFNILPLLLLCVYPCRCFHKCMNHFKLHSHILNTFMDLFQGHFKTYPRDYRHFAAFYLLLRMNNLLLTSFTNTTVYFPLAGTLMILSALLIAIVKPYKQSTYNNIDALLFTLLGLMLLAFPIGSYIHTLGIRYDSDIENVVFGLVCLTHLLYYICLFLYKVSPKKCLFSKHLKLCSFIKKSDTQDETFIIQEDNEQVPLLYEHYRPEC